MALNIYPQEKPHDEAVIIGNRESLRNLRDALTAALDSPEGDACANVFASDEESYSIAVVVDGCDEIDPQYTSEFYSRDENLAYWWQRRPVYHKVLKALGYLKREHV